MAGRPKGWTWSESPEGKEHQRRKALGRRRGQAAADESHELLAEGAASPRRRSPLDDIWEGR